MSSTKCELINGLAITFSLVALSSLLLPFMASIELLALRLLALILTIGHIHYAVSVVQQMCDHFKINCLSLTKCEAESSRQHLLRDSSGSLNEAPLLNVNSSESHENQDSISRSVEDDQLLS